MFLLLLALSIFGSDAQKVTNKVFMDITINGDPAGRIVFGLFGDEVPKTVANFVGLAEGHHGLTYKGTQFWRIMPNMLAQGGDVTRDDGTGGKSIYGNAFADESFSVKLNKKYRLAMANAGRDTNKSQFFIAFNALPWLDGKHVGFGEVIDGFSVVDRIEKLGTWGSGKPKAKVVIADCGELSMEADDAENAVASVAGEESAVAFGINQGHPAYCHRVHGGPGGVKITDPNLGKCHNTMDLPNDWFRQTQSKVCDWNKDKDQWDSCWRCVYGARPSWLNHWCCTKKEWEESTNLSGNACRCRGCTWIHHHTADAVAMKTGSDADHPSYFVSAFALLGFSAILYGAARYYCAKSTVEHEEINAEI